MYPYIIATGPFCLLARFSSDPYHGTSFNDRPRASHLVVVRHFRNGANGQIVATAERVPSRTRDVPVLNNVQSVAFLCNDEERTYRIAELRVITGHYHSALLISFRSDIGRWFRRELRVPMKLRGRRGYPTAQSPSTTPSYGTTSLGGCSPATTSMDRSDWTSTNSHLVVHLAPSTPRRTSTPRAASR
jgi:hypothetical protein